MKFFFPTIESVVGRSALLKFRTFLFVKLEFNPFAPGDFAQKRVLKLVEWFSGHCRAIKS